MQAKVEWNSPMAAARPNTNISHRGTKDKGGCGKDRGRRRPSSRSPVPDLSLCYVKGAKCTTGPRIKANISVLIKSSSQRTEEAKGGPVNRSMPGYAHRELSTATTTGRVHADSVQGLQLHFTSVANLAFWG